MHRVRFLLIAPCLGFLLWGMMGGCKGNAAEDTPMLSLDTIAPHHPLIRYTGRVDFEDPDLPRFAWTGSQVAFAFTGSYVAVTLGHWPGGDVAAAKGQPDFYNVWLDGQLTHTIEVSEAVQRFVLGEGLPDTLHHLSIIKRTEGRVGIGSLRAVELVEGHKLQALPEPPAYRIEFVGNSITCGYGNLGNSATCSFTPRTEDGTQTYASMTAAALEAEMHVVAYSGKGMYRNYQGTTDLLLPKLFLQTLPTDDQASWDFRLWQPHLLVISLGTNDFAQGIPPKKGFVSAYRQFIQAVLSRYPQADILALTGPMLDDRKPAMRRSTLVQWLNELQADLATEGVKLYRFDMTPQGPLGHGCNYHPNVAQHKLNAKELTAFIKENILSAQAES